MFPAGRLLNSSPLYDDLQRGSCFLYWKELIRSIIIIGIFD